jgi:hypothetical protein
MQRLRVTDSPNQNGSSTRAESVTEEPPSVLDDYPENSDVNGSPSVEPATNYVHINGHQEDSTNDHDGFRHQLRRQAGRMFDPRGFSEFRRSYANGDPLTPSLQSPDSEDASNRPHVASPQDGWSSTGRSSPRQAFPPDQGTPVVKSPAPLDVAQTPPAQSLDSRVNITRSELITEIKELIELRTASSTRTLQCLKNLDSQLTTSEHGNLINIAKHAFTVARVEYNYHHASYQTLPASLRDYIELPLPDVDDYEQYIRRLKLQIEELETAVSCFPALQGAAESVRELLDGMCEVIDHGGAEVKMAELRWLVARKCMYWAAIDMMVERTVEWERDKGEQRSPRGGSG